jgi:IS605 OrfB family transposase
MKLVANIKLQPTPEQSELLKRTLERCNEACNWISEQAWEAETFRQFDLHKLVYQAVREQFKLASQISVRCVDKVADAYKLDKETQRTFRSLGAQPYDDRIFRFLSNDQISIWTLHGRIKIRYVCGEHQRQLLKHRKGEVDLMFVRGYWYIAAVCDFDDPELLTPEGVIGVDMGIVNIATDSTGEQFSGKEVETKREWYVGRRALLQKKGTRAAKRRLRKMSGRQRRFQKWVNHNVSRRIVSKAERSRSAISLEDLKHIRARAKANLEQRKRLHNWGFAELRGFIEYKARGAGVPVFIVDPRNTSRQCFSCGHIDKKNRPSQSVFRCVACGHQANADHNAALNIGSRAR